jgi:hypothetical protein
MLAMVEMNGCILNLAVKKPAILVKQVQRTIQVTKAMMILTGIGIPVRSNVIPKT